MRMGEERAGVAGEDVAAESRRWTMGAGRKGWTRKRGRGRGGPLPTHLRNHDLSLSVIRRNSSQGV